MLTSDLLRARVQQKEIRPSLVRVGDPKLQERAEQVLGLFRAGAGAITREGLKQAMDEVVGDGVDHKLVRGLAKVVVDASRFTEEPKVPAPELRARLFEAAAGGTSRARASQVYREVGEELGLTPEELMRLLYSDRKQEQVLLEVGAPDVDWLLMRYNVALVQALLLRCTGLEVRLAGPAPARARQLFRLLKFHGLMHRVVKGEGGFSLHVDGPASLLRLNSRYGIALANWFPALLLQECPWELEGTILWSKRNLKKRLFLTWEEGLVSHTRDTGAYTTRTEAWFQERFLALDSSWTLEEGAAPLDIGENQVVVPDFTFRQNGRVAHLEIVGFWRRSWLKNRMRLLTRGGPENLVLAVSTKMSGTKEALSKFPGRVVYFKEVVPAKDVLACVEACASSP